jgi:hypothetical protein
MSVEFGGEERNATPKARKGTEWENRVHRVNAVGTSQLTQQASDGSADDPIDRRWAELGWREAKDASLA